MHAALIADIVVFVALVGASFVGIVSADAMWNSSELYWSVLTAMFAVGTLLLAFIHRRPAARLGTQSVRIVAQWAGVFVAVHLIFYLVSNNQLTEAEAGLTLSIIFALATYICGVSAEWRLIPIAFAVALATVAATLVQENIWLLLAIAFVALAVVLALDWLRYGRGGARRGPDATAKGNAAG